MKFRFDLLFFLVALALLVSVPAKSEENFTVIDEDTSSDITDSSIATPNFVPGETLHQFLSSEGFTVNGVSDPDAVVHLSNIVLSSTGAAFIITSEDRDAVFSEHDIIGVFTTDGKLLTFQDNVSPPGGNGTPNGGGLNSGPPPPNNTAAVPEPSTWALLFGSLAGLAIFQRLRFARR